MILGLLAEQEVARCLTGFSRNQRWRRRQDAATGPNPVRIAVTVCRLVRGRDRRPRQA
jgi:hypothetical protein